MKHKNQSNIRETLCALFVFLTLCMIPQAFAEPGWKMLKAAPVSPEDARSMRGLEQSAAALGLTITADAPLVPQEQSSTEITPDIDEMARGLQYNPKLIYEFVHNQIDYIPYYGSLKGATMTLLDRNGNDFDQASLMISLLRASGFNAQFGFGVMTIPHSSVDGHDMQHWLNIDNNDVIIRKIMGSGGIPATVHSNSTVMERVWVKATIDSGDYLFDPAFKSYEETEGIDLTTAMAYDSNEILAGAGGTVGTDFVQNLNDSSMRSLLSQYTGNLINYIRTNYPNAAMKEIIGGREIIPEELIEYPASLRFAPSMVEYWDIIPDAYLHKIRIQQGTIDQSLAIATIADKRLSITSAEQPPASMALGVPEVAQFIDITPLSTKPISVQPDSQASPVFLDSKENRIDGTSTTVPSTSITVPTSTKQGVQPNAAPTYSNWDFGRISPTGYSEGTTSITNNTSTLPYQVNVTLLNNSSGAFSIQSGGGTHYLYRNEALDIRVRFSGQQIPGTKTAQLQIEVLIEGNQLADNRVNLSGIEAHPITLGGYGMNVLTYLNEPTDQICRIENNGSVPLTINSMSITGINNSDFSLISGYGAGTIPANSFRDITVRYHSFSHGTKIANITMDMIYDGFNYQGDVLPLQGKSVYKPDLSGSYGVNVGQAYPHKTREGIATLTNSGTYAMTINSLSITGTGSSHWQFVSGNTTGLLAAGATQNITVRYLADTIGTHQANITVAFTYDGIAHSIDLPLIGETLTPPLTQLWLDDDLLAEGDFGESMTMSIDHPYAANNGTYVDETTTYKIEPEATYVIISGFGAKTPERYLEKRQRTLDVYRDSGLADNSREVLSETLYVMGQTWMEETTRNTNLLAQLADVISVSHHRFGVMAQESGYYVDVKTQNHSSVSRHLNIANEDTFFKTTSYLMSAMEHGVLEQLQLERPAASTIKLLSIANSIGQKIFLANSDNFASIEPQLTGYSLEDIETFRADVTNSTTLILPADGQLRLIDWQGKGYIAYQVTSEGEYMGMIIGGGYNGGYGAIMNTSLTIGDVVNDYYPEQKPAADTIFHPYSLDPVDMTTGAFLYDRTDISLGGDEPNGFNFARSYNSTNHRQLSTMGYGWRHNYDIFATVHSDGSAGLGQRSPVDGAALLVASFSCLDLMRGEPDAKDWVTSSLIGNWAMDQLTNNSVSININAKALSYILLPDGSYNPPPGVTTELIQQNGLFRLEDRFGTRIFFNDSNKVSFLQDMDKNLMTFSYSGDQLATVKDSFDRTLTFNYVGELLDSVSDSTGRSIAYGYDGANNLTSYTDLAGKVWEYGYNPSHQLTSLVNPLQVTTATNTYDGLGRVSTQTVPRQGGATVTYNFFFSGTRNVEQDPEGYETIYFYDDKEREVARENQLGHTGQQIFDGQDHVVESINSRQLSTILQYDGNNNLIETKDALDHLFVNSYDDQHRLTETTDPLNNKVNFGYDTEHHPISTTVYPAAGESIGTGTTYYDNGQVHTSSDGREIVTTASYDANGHPQTSQMATEPEVSYSYDSIGRMTSLTDQKSNTTFFDYDDRGLITSSTDPFNRMTSYSYYDDGKLHTVTDRNNQATTTTYTVSGKIDTVSYHDGGSVSFTYDQHDRLNTMTDSLGTTSYSHDAAGRLLSTTDPHGFTVGYGYDENGYTGLLTSITYPGDKQVSYTYDSLNRLETVSNWQNQTATYYYDPAGRLIGLTNFNGSTTMYDYDDANRLTTLENSTVAGATISSQNFITLDGNGNRIVEERIGPVKSAVGLGSLTATYEKNRLRTAGPLSYAQDNVGQRETRSDNTTYSFNSRHRLVDIADGTDSSSYLYDGSVNRLQADRNGTITRYIYDASGNLLAEADQNNVISRYYIHGLGLLAMEVPEIPVGKIYCYHFDALGSTVALTDVAQQVVNHYAYSPFGVLLSNQETVPQPFKYVGQLGVMAEANGLYYMRARFYDPQVGRFVSEDPLGFGGGDVNLYVYGGNNPVLFVDPNGEFATILGGAAGGGLAGGLAGGIVGFFTSLPNAESISDVVVGTMTGTGVGAVVGAAAGAAIGAGQPHLALSAGRLAGSSLFRQGFLAATTAGEMAALTSQIGALGGGLAGELTSPTPAYTPTYGSNIAPGISSNIHYSAGK